MTIDAFIDAKAWEIAEGCRRVAENVVLEYGLREDELDRVLDRLDARDRVNVEQARDVLRACVAALEEGN